MISLIIKTKHMSPKNITCEIVKCNGLNFFFLKKKNYKIVSGYHQTKGRQIFFGLN